MGNLLEFSRTVEPARQVATVGRPAKSGENMDALHALAEALLERETLAESDIDAIICAFARCGARW